MAPSPDIRRSSRTLRSPTRQDVSQADRRYGRHTSSRELGPAARPALQISVLACSKDRSVRALTHYARRGCSRESGFLRIGWTISLIAINLIINRLWT